MTIDKSQGQSLERVGIILDTPVFSHGQLYTALSRCKNPAMMKICVPLDPHTPFSHLKNVVWVEVFPKEVVI